MSQYYDKLKIKITSYRKYNTHAILREVKAKIRKTQGARGEKKGDRQGAKKSNKKLIIEKSI